MPMIDMPLEKLREYKGVNPRPSDFDEYWDRALAELDAIDPKVEFKPYGKINSFITEAYELTLLLPRVQEYTLSS